MRLNVIRTICLTYMFYFKMEIKTNATWTYFKGGYFKNIIQEMRIIYIYITIYLFTYIGDIHTYMERKGMSLITKDFQMY